MEWLKKDEVYTASNGNKGTFRGTWLSTAGGIKFVLENEEGRVVGYLDKKEVLKWSKK